MSRFKFSLRTLLASVAVIGIGAALWVAEPSWQVGLSQTFMIVAVPASLLVASVQSKGLSRGFFIGVSLGTAIPSVSHIFQVAVESRTLVASISLAGGGGPQELGFLSGVTASAQIFKLTLCLWSLAPFVGLASMLTHWLLIRPPQGPTD